MACSAAARSAARQPRPVLHASFHETKNFICGEGGALVLNDAERRRPRPRPLRQGHQPPGVPPRPGRQVLVAGHRLVVRARRRAGRIPLRPARAARRDPGQAARRSTATSRPSRPAPTSSASGCRSCPRTRAGVPHVLRAAARPGDARRVLAGHARRRVCTPTFHYVPLHSSTAGALRRRPTACPVTDDVSGRLLRLPFYNNLTDAEIDRVVDVVPGRARRGHRLTTLRVADVASPR